MQVVSQLTKLDLDRREDERRGLIERLRLGEAIFENTSKFNSLIQENHLALNADKHREIYQLGKSGVSL